MATKTDDLPVALYEVLEAELRESYAAFDSMPEAQGYLARKKTLEAAWKGDWDGKKAISEELVPEIYRLIARLKEKRSALCLSGGGIRSATFNLGILQGLARHGVLDKFDYLSTVSGGGWSGAWLTAWIKREGIESVMKQLADRPQSPLEADPVP